MQTVFAEATSALRETPRIRFYGRVRAMTGLTLIAGGLDRSVGIGRHCIVHGHGGPIRAVALGVDENGVHLLPFGNWDGVISGDLVEVCDTGDVLRPDDSWLGRVVDALGRPLDEKGFLPEGPVPMRVSSAAPPALHRKPVGARLETGLRPVDVFTPICRGQRLGIFAGSGVGKTTLMGMLAKQAEADVIVLGLIGERGREVQEFIKKTLGEEGLARSVLVVSTGDQPALMRRQAARTATVVAEYFRDRGKHVLLLLDSVTRFAMAQREIGLALGEPPTAKGYTPSVFSELSGLLERSGPGVNGKGDITALYTVLVEGDDFNEPVTDTVRGIMDGHIILSRRIAERGRFPAIDTQRSISRMLPGCHSPREYSLLVAAKRALTRYDDMEELIRLGAYSAGSDPELDSAIKLAGMCTPFLSQQEGDATPTNDAFTQLEALLHASGVAIPALAAG